MAISDRAIITRLLLAVPDVLLEEEARKYLVRQGYIDPEMVERFQEMERKIGLAKKFRRDGVVDRFLAIGPEAFSNTAIDFLGRFGYLDRTQVQTFKFAARTLGTLGRGGLPQDAADVSARFSRLFGTTMAHETVSMLKVLGVVDKTQAKYLHSGIETRDITNQVAWKYQQSKKLMDMLSLARSPRFNNQVIDLMKTSGLLAAQTANGMKEAAAYGRSLWTVFEGAQKAEGLAARVAYATSGAFSLEAMAFLKAMGLISPEYERLFLWATRISVAYNRTLMERMTNRRFRVTPAEAPIRTFARTSQTSERRLLSLLAEAAAQARKDALLIPDTVRGDQLNLAAKALHDTLRETWEGVGYVTIAGESEVAAAAVESSENMQRRLKMIRSQLVQTMLEHQARAGVNSFISRQENTLELSRRVYNNLDLWTGRVDKQINLQLLQGKSATEMAAAVSKMISPKVPGGVSYAAMRLARTEINNAFHTTTIRHSREMPWVNAYQWNLSGSHGKPDVCNQMAGDDHDGLGPGVYKKKNVPGKPHPQCLCFITTVTVDDDKFIKNMKRGFYDDYLRQISAGFDVQTNTTAQIFTNHLARRAGTLAGQAAATAAGGALLRMLESGDLPNPGVSLSGLRAARTNLLARLRRKGVSVPEDVTEALNYEVTTEDLAALTDTEIKISMTDINKSVARIMAASKEKFGDGDYQMMFEVDSEGVAQDVDQLAKLASISNKQKSFDKAFEDRKSRFYQTYYDREYAPDGTSAWIEDHYKDLFEEEEKMRERFQVNLEEKFAKSMYTQTSYRSMNAKLRTSGGDLDAYDDMFPSENVFETTLDISAGVKGSIRNGQSPAESLTDMRETISRLAKADVEINGRDQFGFRDFDAVAYYEGLMEEATDPATVGVFDSVLKRTYLHSDVIRSLDKSMVPTKRDTMLYRITGPEFFGLDRPLSPGDEGLEFVDSSFISTEGRPEYFNSTGSNSLDTNARSMRLMIQAPKGTYATRASVFENEILLSRGTKFQIMEVLDVSGDPSHPFSQEVRVSIVDQISDILEDFSGELEVNDDDMYDAIFDNMDF